jgi:hypothetical protein
MVEQPDQGNIEIIVEQTWTHMATNVNVHNTTSSPISEKFSKEI